MALIAVLVYKLKGNQFEEYFEKRNEHLKSAEETIYCLKRFTWIFLKGKKYDQESFRKFLGIIRKEFNESSSYLLDSNKKIEKISSPFIQKKEEIKDIFYLTMLRNFKLATLR